MIFFINKMLNVKNAGFFFFYLPVPLQVLPHSHGLLDQVIQILRQVRSQTFGFQDPEDFVAGDEAHLSHAMRVPQDHT